MAGTAGARIGPQRTAALLLATFTLVGLGASPTRDERLAERNARAWESLRLREAGRTAEGLSAAEAMLAVERELFPPKDEDLAGALELVAGAHMADADFEGAQTIHR